MTAPNESELQQGFDLFIAAAQELERSYLELRQRAAAVDLELAATNRALESSLREREAIVAALPLGICALRGSGEVHYRNGEGERLCALASAHGIDLPRRGAGEVALGTGVVRVRRVALPDGELVLLEDRSRLHELEREVDRLDRLAGLSELALGIAHDIRNPLNGVLGFAALLGRAADPEAIRRYAGKMVQGLRQIDATVKALLGFARPERGRGRTASIAEVAAEAAAAACLPLQRLEIAGARELRADADALVRVLSNLLRNAVEAAPDVRIRVHAAARGGRLELTVEDTGPGVPKELGRRVLEPFVSTKERGTGLGLSLCVRVLSYLGGGLELLNPGEPGARFLVRLPLAEPSAAPASEPAIAEAAP